MALTLGKTSGLLSVPFYPLERSYSRGQDIIVVHRTGFGARLPGQISALLLITL